MARGVLFILCVTCMWGKMNLVFARVNTKCKILITLLTIDMDVFFNMFRTIKHVLLGLDYLLVTDFFRP